MNPDRTVSIKDARAPEEQPQCPCGGRGWIEVTTGEHAPYWHRCACWHLAQIALKVEAYGMPYETARRHQVAQSRCYEPRP